MSRQNMPSRRAYRTAGHAFCLALVFFNAGSAFAETMNNALAKAYLSNWNINYVLLASARRTKAFRRPYRAIFRR